MGRLLSCLNIPSVQRQRSLLLYIHNDFKKWQLFGSYRPWEILSPEPKDKKKKIDRAQEPVSADMFTVPIEGAHLGLSMP